MSAISSIGVHTLPYTPASSGVKHPKPTGTTTTPLAPTASTNDRGHDGDVDGPGLDVAG